MNTIQIEHSLKKDPFTKTIFEKACAKNQLIRVDYPSAYVINSHPSSKPKEHWIAVYFDKHGKGEYFDSYGLHPSMNGVLPLLWNVTQTVGFTTTKLYKVCFLQRVVIIVCILFCILVVVIACVILFLVSHQILLKIIVTLTCLFVLSCKSNKQTFSRVFYCNKKSQRKQTTDFYSMNRFETKFNYFSTSFDSPAKTLAISGGTRPISAPCFATGVGFKQQANSHIVRKMYTFHYKYVSNFE